MQDNTRVNKKSSSTIEVGGYSIAYSSSGEGEVVLLVHGITTYSFIWRKIVPLLDKNYRVLTIDLPGCGNSSKQLEQTYSIKNHAQLLKSFVQKLHIEKFHLVGHDVGGGVCQIFAVNYPEMLFDLTLVNTVAYDFLPVQPIIAMRTPIIRQFAMATLDFGTLRMIVRRGLYHPEALTSELMDYFWAPMKTREGRKAFLHFAASLDNNNLTEISDKLSKLTLPVLIIRGDGDPYLSGVIAEKLAKNIPNSSLVKIATGGHFIQEDEPLRLAEEMENFFQEQK
jgi:pimeloyl-ACP methyl ester carboxylesterase